ncbi:DUF1878 family protein [Thalassobacillus sp. CUG 92003]|uniref:DUF1878 family protein n=1 Tax=Thalassobacillus sp. CUG 92003 TaxID=2736641 RepID=UPI0015E78D59|nr:DUF1878 family protein [Thalassobacillus sp. CUG 92003]
MGENEQCQMLSFHVQLMSNLEWTDAYPFTKMVITHNLTKTEYEQVFFLMEELHDTYEKYQAEGFVDYSPLLIHFAGMLSYKLNPNQALRALYQEGIYPKLTGTLVTYLRT